MATVNQEMSDALTRHAVYLYRVELGMRNQINASLDATIPQLRALLLESTALESMRQNTAAYTEALASLDRKIAKVRGKGFTAAQAASRTDYIAAIANEVEYTDDLMKTGLVGPLRKGTRKATKDALTMGAVTKTQGENILAYGEFQGRTIKRWWTGMEAADITKIDQAVRTGLADGQTMQQITRTIVGTKAQNYKDGVIETTRRNAETVARTTLNGVTNDARLAYYEQNSDIVSEVEYLATLDSRTSEICASRDGKVYKLGTEPALPAHPNCRSTYIPVVDGFEAATERPAITKNLNKEAQAQYMEKQVGKGMSRTNARKKWNGLARSTKDKYYYEQYGKYADAIGPVSGSTTYESFLRRQPKEFVHDHMGVVKGDMFLKGGLDSSGKKVSLGTFVNNDTGRPFTIAQMRTREAALYKRTFGITPAPAPTPKPGLAAIAERKLSKSEATKQLLDLGVEEVKLTGVNTHLFSEAVRGVEVLKDKGLDIPKAIVSQKYNSRAIAFASRGRIGLNTRRISAKTLDAQVDSGFWSQRNTILHEQGHNIHQARTGSRYDVLSNWSSSIQKDIAGKVSKYARVNPKEFVAEVFAGRVSGIQYDDEIMRLYRLMDGPPL